MIKNKYLTNINLPNVASIGGWFLVNNVKINKNRFVIKNFLKKIKNYFLNNNGGKKDDKNRNIKH